MSLLEVLIIHVAPALAKGILKVWLRDEKISTEVGSSLIDLIKSKATDIGTQRRASRQLEAIGERAAESLLPVFLAERSNIDDPSHAAIALAIAKTLESGGVDPSLLFANDLDPVKLTNYLLDQAPGDISDFSFDELSLYRRVLGEAAAQIIDVGCQLPNFAGRSMAEVIRRENDLLRIATETLDEVHRIRQGSESSNLESDAARFEFEYRRALVRALDQLEIFGVDSPGARRRHRLSIAYVSLSLNTNVARDGSRVVQSVTQALEQSPRLLIRGLAGSGKTTLLQWVAVQSGLNTFEYPLDSWNDTVPFFIPLRQCLDKWPLRPEDFPTLVTPSLIGTMPSHWVHRQLNSGRAIVLVDGIDEIPALRRADIRSWLDDLVGTYPRSRFIVTSRPHAVNEDWLTGADLIPVDLLPMELSDIDTFIEHWHLSMQRNDVGDLQDRNPTSLVENLKRIVRTKRSIRNLATNPLLCSLICALHHAGGEQLPTDRIQLYEACCHLLMEGRDAFRRVPLTDYSPLDYRQKKSILQDFAYWMQANGWNRVTIDDADRRLGLGISKMNRLRATLNASEVRRFFVERTCIIRESTATYIDFTHRSFQEYLAALEAVEEGNLGVLIENAHEDHWREVVILAAGYAGSVGRNSLILGLIERGDREVEHRHQLHLLAVACLESSIRFEPSIVSAVENRLSALVPPKNDSEARALVAADDLAVPHLAWRPDVSAPVAAACAWVLGQVGGDQALELLEAYASDPRPEVGEALFRASVSFPQDAYAIRIFSKLRHLRLQRVTDRVDLNCFVSLEGLDIWSSPGVTDLRPLAKLPAFTSLTIENSGDLGTMLGLSELRNLVKVRADRCVRLGDLQVLSNLCDMRELALGRCPPRASLSQLENLVRLRSLYVGDIRRVTGLEPLRRMHEMTSLHLEGSGRVSSLAPLGGMRGLTRLELLGFQLDGFRDLSGLEGLADLSQLVLEHCGQLEDLRHLSALAALRRLTLTGLPVLKGIGPLAGLRRLTALDISSSGGVDDLAALAKMEALTSLHLQGFSEVTMLEPIAGLRGLRELSLVGFTGLVDVSPLAELEHLVSLDLTECAHVRDLRPLRALKALKRLDISNCWDARNVSMLEDLGSLQIIGPSPHSRRYRGDYRVVVPAD